MGRKSGQVTRAKKTTVNRLFFFFVIGLTTAAPMYILGAFFGSDINLILMPLVIIVALIRMVVKEERTSEVRPNWLEFFLSSLGALYPSVLVAIVLWLVWWIIYGILVLFGMQGGFDEAAYIGASTVYGLLSLVIAFFLVRMNWRHLVDQLYPIVGSQSAFAKISQTGKAWLIKRGILLSIISFITLVIYIVIAEEFLSEGQDITIGDEFLLNVFIIIIYLFLISMSAWLWLRKPEIQRGIEVTNKAIARLLQPLGYEVQTLAEIINKPGQEGVVSDQMTASVDLVACRQDSSIVVDVMTLDETPESPDWVAASEFRMATWYLQRVLQLPTPVQAIFVLVDIIADDALSAFAEDYDIKVVQLSSEEVVELLAPDMSEPAFQESAERLFSPLLNNFGDKSSMTEPELENGGRNE